MTTLTLPLVDNNDEDEEDVRLFITRHNPIISFIRDNKISEVQEWLDEAQRLQDDRWLSSYFVAEVSLFI